MPKKILIACFKHETNTFSNLPTDISSYLARTYYHGAEVPDAFRGTRTEIGAYLDACDRYDWQAVFPVVADAQPSGPVTRDAFESISNEILTCLTAEGPFDAVLLALHGAMVCEHVDDGEGELLARIRDRIGPDIPVAASLDLHANVTDKMAQMADILVAYRTYPHIDQYEAAEQTASLLSRTLKDEINPCCVVVRGDMLDALDHGRTTSPGPMTEVLASADKFLSRPGVLSVSVCVGFPWADVYEAGPSALFVGEKQSADGFPALADTLIQEAWEKRRRKTITCLSVKEAMLRVKASTLAPEMTSKPIILADFADNPGGGGYGDSNLLLKGMIDAGLQNAVFGTIYDPASAQTCRNVGLGGHVVVELGGKIDRSFNAPLSVTGTVQALTNGQFNLQGPMATGTRIDMGCTAIIRIGGIEVVITSQRFQVFDQMYFKHARIDLESKSVIAVKSAHHFRAAFGPLASEVICVDSSDGLTSCNFKELPFRKVRSPVYPLDEA